MRFADFSFFCVLENTYPKKRTLTKRDIWDVRVKPVSTISLCKGFNAIKALDYKHYILETLQKILVCARYNQDVDTPCCEVAPCMHAGRQLVTDVGRGDSQNLQIAFSPLPHCSEYNIVYYVPPYPLVFRITTKNPLQFHLVRLSVCLFTVCIRL